MGENTATRSQFTFSLAAVFLLYFSYQSFLEYFPGVTQLPSRLRQWAPIVLLLMITVTQIATVRYIWNAHSYIAHFDKETAADILALMYDSPIVNENIGTILWGYLQPDTPYDDQIEDSPSYLFTSVFNLEHNMHPYCFYSTHRVLGYLESIGHTFTYPELHNHAVSRYIMIHNNLAAFPEEGCSFNDPEGFTINLGNSPENYFE